MEQKNDSIVSVIIPVKNCGAYVGSLLEDLARQSLCGLEILVIYDHSEDDTYQAVAAACARDARMSVIQGDGSGPGGARNRGMDAAHGRYLLFLDGDDRIACDMIETMYAAIEREDADICLCKSVEFRSDGRRRKIWDAVDAKYLPAGIRSWRDCPERFFQAFNGWAWDKLIRRDFCKRHGLRFGENYMLEDGCFVLPAMALAERICVLDNVLIAHRKWSESLEASQNNQNIHWRNVLENGEKIARTLYDAGLYDVLGKSFLNWLLNYTLWVLGKTEGLAQREMLTCLQESFWPRTDLEALEDGDFYNGRDRYLYKRLSLKTGRKIGPHRVQYAITGGILQLDYRLRRHGLRAAVEHILWMGDA